MTKQLPLNTNEGQWSGRGREQRRVRGNSWRDWWGFEGDHTLLEVQCNTVFCCCCIIDEMELHQWQIGFHGGNYPDKISIYNWPTLGTWPQSHLCCQFSSTYSPPFIRHPPFAHHSGSELMSRDRLPPFQISIVASLPSITSVSVLSLERWSFKCPGTHGSSTDDHPSGHLRLHHRANKIFMVRRKTGRLTVAFSIQWCVIKWWAGAVKKCPCQSFKSAFELINLSTKKSFKKKEKRTENSNEIKWKVKSKDRNSKQMANWGL